MSVNVFSPEFVQFATELEYSAANNDTDRLVALFRANRVWACAALRSAFCVALQTHAVLTAALLLREALNARSGVPTPRVCLDHVAVARCHNNRSYREFVEHNLELCARHASQTEVLDAFQQALTKNLSNFSLLLLNYVNDINHDFKFTGTQPVDEPVLHYRAIDWVAYTQQAPLVAPLLAAGASVRARPGFLSPLFCWKRKLLDTCEAHKALAALERAQERQITMPRLVECALGLAALNLPVVCVLLVFEWLDDEWCAPHAIAPTRAWAAVKCVKDATGRRV